MEFWTVGLDEFDKIVFFDTTSSHSIDEYNFTIDKGYIADQYKAGLANSDIKIYNKDKLTKDIMITIDVILILVLILEILTSRTKINKLVYNN